MVLCAKVIETLGASEDLCHDGDVRLRHHDDEMTHIQCTQADDDHATLKGPLAVDKFASGDYCLEMRRSNFPQRYYADVFMLG